MGTYNPAITAYEDFLTGRKKDVFLAGSDNEQEAAVYSIIRYAMHLRRWEPNYAAEHITDDVFHALKLDHIVKRYITVPPSIDRSDELKYLVCRAYPFELYFDEDDSLLKLYRRIIRNKAIAKETGNKKKQGLQTEFPPGIFTDPENGAERLRLLFNEFLSSLDDIRIESVNALDKKDVYEVYRAFSRTAAMNTKLRKACLYAAYKSVYKTPLEFAHNSIPADAQNEELYRYFTFCEIFRNDRAQNKAKDAGA